MSYQELAIRIRMSESGVKKIFAGEDVSLSRLSQICDALDVNLVDDGDPMEIRPRLFCTASSTAAANRQSPNDVAKWRPPASTPHFRRFI